MKYDPLIRTHWLLVIHSKIFYRAGNERCRFEHQYCSLDQDRRKAAGNGFCVLGRHYCGNLGDAACAGNLVKRKREADSGGGLSAGGAF